MPPATLASKPIGRLRDDSEGEEFVSVLGEELFVGGDDGLAVLEGSAKKLQGVVDAAHGLDDDVNVVGCEELFPAGGDAGSFGGVGLGISACGGRRR